MFKQSDYNDVFNAMRHSFGESWYAGINPVQWNIWRRQIKEILFLGIEATLQEIHSAIDMAGNKKQWPIGTALIKRIRDIVLVQRKQRGKITIVNTGPESMGDLLKRRLVDNSH